MSISKKDHGLIMVALQKSFSRSDLRRTALDRALSDERGPRGGKTRVCAKCGKSFPDNQVSVDHISPTVPVDRHAYSMKIGTIISRMWCALSNLQVLCKQCHKDKTNKEKQQRASNKKRGKLK